MLLEMLKILNKLLEEIVNVVTCFNDEEMLLFHWPVVVLSCPIIML